MKIPAELKPEEVVAIVDTREKLPLDLTPLTSKVATLDLADYSVEGLEHIVRIERKSLDDLLACVTRERPRFDREMERLRAYPVRAVVVESTWTELEAGQWRNHVTPAAVIGSCLGWAADGVPLIMAGDHERAGRYVARLLYIAARRRYRELRKLLALMPDVEHSDGNRNVSKSEAKPCEHQTAAAADADGYGRQ